MAKITLKLLKTEPLRDGTCRVALMVSHKQRVAYYRTHVTTTPERWHNGHVIGHERTDAVLQKILAEARIALHDVERAVDIATLTPHELRERVMAVVVGETREAVPQDYALPLFDRKIATLPARRTREIYTVTRNKVEKYAGNVRLSQITPEWLRLFDLWMDEQGTHSRNARNIDMRNLRAVYNFAIDEGMVVNYPFRRFKIKPQETAKRALTMEQLRALINAPLTPPRSEARDMFLLSFLLLGINPADMFDLRRVTAGRVTYTRHKTGKLYDVLVLPQAQAIIDRYRGTRKLLSICERYTSARTFLDMLNTQLQRIHLPELGDTLLTMYWARHTWATIAASLEIPRDTIAQALGHSQHSVTEIYIKNDPAKVDDANKKVIGAVLSP